jgi:hypothetical protein
VGDVEACVHLFWYSPRDLIHLTCASSTSFSAAQVVAAQEAVVAVVVPGEVAGVAVAMEAVSSFKRSEVFWIMTCMFSGGGGGCGGGGCGGGGCGGGGCGGGGCGGG